MNKIAVISALALISSLFGSCARSRYTHAPDAVFEHQIAIPEANLDADKEPPVGPIVGECGWVEQDGEKYYVVRWKIVPVVQNNE